jgi:hypothetical protein
MSSVSTALSGSANGTKASARLRSSRLRISRRWSRKPRWLAAVVASCHNVPPITLSGCNIIAIRLAPGSASLRSSSRFCVRPSAMFVVPVTFPPGRATFVTNLDVSGSPTSTMTIGMVFVAVIAALVAADVDTTMSSTLCCTNSLVKAGSCVTSPSANRSSIERFFPSSHPRLPAPAGMFPGRLAVLHETAR